MTTPNNIPNLSNLKPAVIEVAGKDLEAVLAGLRQRYVHVTGMEVVDNALWRLRLVWDEPDEPKAA